MAQSKRIVTIVVLILALVGLSAGAFFLLYQPEPEGIVIGITNLPDSLNPVGEQNITALNANEFLFDGLVNWEVDKDSGAMYSEFSLAESMDQDPETKKIYTVTLKQVAWHDSTPEAPHMVSADDVVFSFAAYMDPENKSPQRTYLDSFIQSVTKVEDVSDEALKNRVVKIEFRKPIPEFRAYPVLTFKIIPAAVKDKSGALKTFSTNMRSGDLERSFATKPVGTGPFKFDTWEIGKWVTFSANTAYARKQPATSNLVLRSIIDPVIRMNEFQKKKINMILETSPMDRASVEKIDNVVISSFMPYSFYQVAVNTTRPAFEKVDGRVAMASVIKSSTLLPGITDREGMSLINYGPFPTNILERNAAAYNPEPLPNNWITDLETMKAKAESAGLVGKNVSLMFPDSMGDFGQKVCEGIATQLGQIGIAVEVKRTGDQVFKRMVYNDKDFDLALQYCDGFDNWYSDLDKYYRTGGALNVTGVADAELDQLFDYFNSRALTEEMFKAVHDIHNKVTGIAPDLPLFSLQKDIYSRGIQNVVIASDNPFLSVEDWAQVK